ncbi:hypothetical protein [Aquisphaera insulae]|nr:hypothetical protein [Aquisphaera insulae]
MTIRQVIVDGICNCGAVLRDEARGAWGYVGWLLACRVVHVGELRRTY